MKKEEESRNGWRANGLEEKGRALTYIFNLPVWRQFLVAPDRCLLRQPVAEGVIAKEAHNADFAVEAL